MNRSAKQVVSAFLTALNEENFDKAEKCLAKDMLFDGVMGKRNSAHSYIRDMRKMRFKYDIQKIFVSGNDVCVVYDIDMSGKATIFTCGWYRVSGGKIKKLRVVFDPRPLLKGEKK